MIEGVGTATESQQMHKIYSSTKPSKVGLEPSLLLIQWVPGSFPKGTAT
jgi:hypothetical protein